MKMRLGPLPDVSVVKISITLPTVLKREIDKYAELHSKNYGTPVDAAVLIPIMLTHFLAADKIFQQTLRHEASASKRSM